MSEVLDLSACDLAARVRHRDVSAVEVHAAAVARIEALNPALNAIINFDPAAGRRDAQNVERAVREGRALPLAGVPFTVKDTLWVAGQPATQGSLLFKDFIAPQDSLCVARMRAAGAVFVGMTNCPEFACKGTTNNLLYGATHNPWRHGLTPGGSSGGAAAAVAAGLCHIGLATDAGGSIRRPAAHTGTVGHKPSIGLIPNPTGFAEPGFGFSVIGSISRDVADAALALTCLAGYDAGDPFPCVPGDTDALLGRADGMDDLRIAYSPRLGLDFAVDSHVREVLEATVARLRDAGWAIAEADPEWPPGTGEYPLISLQQAGLAALFGERCHRERNLFDADIAAQIDIGTRLGALDLARALFLRDALYKSLDRFFSDYDLLLCPVAPVTSWPVDQLAPAVIEGRPATFRGHAAFTPLFNYCGVPACSVPCGLASDDLPVGIQVVGRRYEDARVLAGAAAIERVLALALRPSMGRPT